MIRDFFWLTDDQFVRLKPPLPTDTRGKPRVDDRRGHCHVRRFYLSIALGVRSLHVEISMP
jgi:hypothetical protein